MSDAEKITRISKKQQKILAFFQSKKFSEEELSDIEQMLSDYYAKKTQRSIDDYVREQGWTQKDLERMSKAHIRTPYQK
jgi:ribosomal protein L11 methylase PrmA